MIISIKLTVGGGERREIERGCVTSVKGSIIMTVGAFITTLVAMCLVIGVPQYIVHPSQSIIETDISIPTMGIFQEGVDRSTLDMCLFFCLALALFKIYLYG